MKETKKCAVTNRASHKIGWLNLPGYKGETWNPIIGCSKVSAGCKNCYAERMAVRLAHINSTDYYGDVLKIKSPNLSEKVHVVWNGTTQLIQSQLTKPMKWKKPRVVFVCSMGDLFHENTSFEDINAVFSVMSDCDQHIYIVLTKRAKRMVAFFNWKTKQHNIPWRPKDNVWLGVTAENQETANQRIPHLMKVPAAVRFVSVEPMLSTVNLNEYYFTQSNGTYLFRGVPEKDRTRRIHLLDWVICGGESGPGSRPMHPDWARSLRDQCKEAEVPFFFKQWGEWMPMDQVNDEQFFASKESKEVGYGYTSNTVFKVGKKAAGNLLDGERWEQYPKPATCKLKL
jgi:protein gp37